MWQGPHSSHNNFGHHLVSSVTQIDGAVIIQSLRVSILRDKSDKGLVKVLRDNPFCEDVLDFIFNRFSGFERSQAGFNFLISNRSVNKRNLRLVKTSGPVRGAPFSQIGGGKASSEEIRETFSNEF